MSDLKAATESRLNDIPFSGQKDDEEVSLGNPVCVEQILRNHVNDAMNGQSLERITKQLSRIFLGRRPGYRIVSNWNQAGAIDVELGKVVNSTEKRAFARMQHFFAQFFIQIAEIFENEELHREVAVQSAEQLLKQTRDYLLGLRPGLGESLYPVETERSDEQSPPS